MAGSKNVLLIEDEPMLRALYRKALTENRYAVEEAVDAEDAYAKLANFNPDYIFLDIMLPGKSGLEVLQELRANPDLGCLDAKIIVLTNLAQRSVADNAMEHGADGYIIKADILPTDLPEIIESLEYDE